MNRICLSLIGCALLAVSTQTAAAQSQKTDIRPHANRLTGDELRAAFAGVTHKGAYNFSEAGDPRKFYTETTDKKGRTVYTDKISKAEGDWAIKNDILCFTYDDGQMAGGCFRVYQVGNCFYYYGNSMIYSRNELDRDYWTARSTIAGTEINCEPGLS